MTMKLELVECTSISECRICCNSLLGVPNFFQAILTFTWVYRSVPTKNDILAPETVLKKRKSQEKERELRATETKKKKEVRK